jgi:very-short-patch-repair endonuclease
MPIRSAQWVEANRNLVNVGASRARRLLILVGHPDAAAAHDLPTLGSLWTAAATSVVDETAVDAELTEPERRFWRAFDDALGTITPRQRVEGYDVDFAWTAPWGMTVDIEIDDDQPGAAPRSRRRDIERDRVLNRVGWQVVRIPGWYCYAHPDAVIDSLRDTLTTIEDPTSSTVELMPWVGR